MCPRIMFFISESRIPSSVSVFDIGHADGRRSAFNVFYRKTGIEFYKPHGNIGISYKEEWVKNNLCRRNHITMIRLLEKKYKDFDNCICLTYLGYSLEILDQLIKKVFSLVHIETDIDIIDDIFEIESVWKASIIERQ